MATEEELVSLIKKRLSLPQSLDDAQTISFSGKNLVASTDMLTEGDDFPPGMPYDAMGWNAVAANLSDIAAAGAKPLGLLMALGLPREMPPDGASQIAEGMAMAAKASRTRVIGGDLNETEKIIISGTAFGAARYPLARSGAKPGDIIAVTGKLGAAAAGYLICWSKKEKKSAAEERMLQRFYYPPSRVQLMAELNAKRLAHAATDISDGFSSAVHAICAESGTGALVEYIGLPMFEGFEEYCKKNGKQPLELLNLACDYEIVIAIPQEAFHAAKRIAASKGCELFEVGTFLKKDVLLEKDGKLAKLPKKGFAHFE